MSEPFDLDALIEEFRDEARDQVDRLDAALLELEREGGLGDDRRRSLLRTLHTLKGNAGMLGLGPVRDFVHALENVFKAGAPFGQERLERLFEAAAALRRAVESSGGGGQAAAFRDLTLARHPLAEVEAGAGAAEAAGRGPDPGRDEPASGPDRLRVPFAKLDALLNQVGELMGEADALVEEASAAGRALRERADAVRRRADVLREAVMGLRLVPLGRVLGRFGGLVRRLAREQGKEARVVLEGEATEVDKSTADALAEPLLHLVRNAIDHGIEPPEVRERMGKPRHGTVTLRAEQAGDRLRLEVSDDGAGLELAGIRSRGLELGLLDPETEASDAEVARLIFRPGFSTRTEVSTVSGQGVGLDVVLRSVRELRGDLRLERRAEGGTRFVLLLPLTVAIVPSLVFTSAGEVLALPLSAVSRTLRLGGVERVGATEVVRDGEELVPLARPGRLFGWDDGGRGEFAVVVRQGGRSAAVTAAGLLDRRDLVVKAVPDFGGRPHGVTGASVLPDGRVVLVLDPAELIELNLHQRKRSGGADG